MIALDIISHTRDRTQKRGRPTSQKVKGKGVTPGEGVKFMVNRKKKKDFSSWGKTFHNMEGNTIGRQRTTEILN